MTVTRPHRLDHGQRLDHIASRYAAKAAVHGLELAVVRPSTGLSWSFREGGRPYFIASITKLYTTALVMKLRSEGVVELTTPASDFLGGAAMEGLVVVDGVDHSTAITVGQLLSHTSGVPDYYATPERNGASLAEQMMAADRFWSFEEFVDRARALPAPFAPRDVGPAHYSDTNFQLLGRIVEVVSGLDFVAAVEKYLLDPLGLEETWHVPPNTVDRHDEVSPVRLGRRRLEVPAALASMAPDGGMVSTASDQLRFLQAFMGGEIFPTSYLAEMTARWNVVRPRMGPLRYGTGLMRFALPRWQSAGFRVPPMVGHSGSFGSILYHVPESGLFIAGTVNQVRPPSLPYPLLARIALAAGGRAR